ncbi:MAG: hypothetical protein IH840_02160 [Candidatus Heimdallarchaeota archaeon]|nr:hypothetical protein [Candidatus Heimdallarchaeota archaeon]
MSRLFNTRRLLLSLVLIACISISTSFGLESENINWNVLHPEQSPPPVDSLSLVYSPTDEVAFTFGGVIDIDQVPSEYEYGIPRTISDSNITWIYQIATNQWISRVDENQPKGRRYAAMSSNFNRNEILMFGGWSAGVIGDTWIYNLANGEWMEIISEIAPDPRYTEVVFDTRRQVSFLFSGWTGEDRPGDSWYFDHEQQNWVQLQPINSPPGRNVHALAYDEKYDKIILYGGYDGVEGLTDTWTYDWSKNTWTNQEPKSHPTSHNGAKMVYVASIGKVVLFGGRTHHNKIGTVWYNEIWIYDYSLNLWEEVEISDTTIPSLSDFGMTYDRLNNRILIFGGRNDALEWPYRDNELYSITFTPNKNGYTYIGSKGPISDSKPSDQSGQSSSFSATNFPFRLSTMIITIVVLNKTRKTLVIKSRTI